MLLTMTGAESSPLHLTLSSACSAGLLRLLMEFGLAGRLHEAV
jgi:hypothetical protein